MGKRGKASRKRRCESNDIPPSAIASKILKKHVNEHRQEWNDQHDEHHVHGISDEALDTTIATLQRLCDSGGVGDKSAIKDKRYRNLRRVVYDVQKLLGGQTSAKSVGSNGAGLLGHSSVANTVSASKITNEITEQIEHGAWENAIATLRNMARIQELQRLLHQANEGTSSDPTFNQYRPKLGSLQRWVREIDAAGTDDPVALEVLDAILRVVAPESLLAVDKADLDRATWAKLGVGMSAEDKVDTDSNRGRIRLFPACCCQKPIYTSGGELNAKGNHSTNLYDTLVSGMLCGADGIRYLQDSKNAVTREQCFRICGHEDGPDRKPPNKYDLDLLTTSVINEQQLLDNKDDYTTISSCNILFKDDINCNPIKKTSIPYVRNTFLLENVLSRQECDRLIAAAELAGYFPDEPLAGQSGASILAHACVWVVDYQMERTIFERVKGFLPQYKESKSGHPDTETLHPLGVNRRFRFYRYVPGRYYRPHIDGAWPSSGFDVNGAYRYDINDIGNKNGIQFVHENAANDGNTTVNAGESMPEEMDESSKSPTRPQLSRLTFLIYLNDDFEGGNTTFFVPSSEHEGVLNAFPVKPTRGCVLVFPHGTCAAPLHEGSPVLKGCKYVVRTEVEYYL